MGLPGPDRLVPASRRGRRCTPPRPGSASPPGPPALAGSLAPRACSPRPPGTLRDAAGANAGSRRRHRRAARRGGRAHRHEPRDGRGARGERWSPGSTTPRTATCERLAEAGKAMFEPPAARRTPPRVGARGHAHLELAAPAVEGGPSVRRALRRQLERLDGVEWAAVNDAVGRVLVTFDERRVRVDDVVERHRGRRAGARRHAGLPAAPGPPRRPRAAGRGAGRRRPSTPSGSASPSPGGCCRSRG